MGVCIEAPSPDPPPATVDWPASLSPASVQTLVRVWEGDDVIWGGGGECVVPRDQSRGFTRALISFAWGGVELVAAAGMGGPAHISEPMGNQLWGEACPAIGG